MEVGGCSAAWNHQNVKLTLWRESLRNPAWVLFPSQQDTCAQTSLPLCTPLLLYFSASLLLYPCTPVPLYSYSTLWSWESHPPLLSHHLDSRSWNSFENSRVLCCAPMQWMPTTCGHRSPLLSSRIIEVPYSWTLGILLRVPELSLPVIEVPSIHGRIHSITMPRLSQVSHLSSLNNDVILPILQSRM